jgi:hypothetical protein
MSNNGFNVGVVAQLLNNMNVPPTISARERHLLWRLIVENDSATGEQLTRFVPGGWMLGSDHLSPQLCFRLIRHSFISQDGEENGGVSYWRVNDMGRMAVEGKSLAAIHEAVR